MARGGLVLAGISGASAVALGAVGAHHLPVSTPARVHWDAAAEYQLLHSVLLAALAISGVAQRGPVRAATWCIGVGMLLFCGMLYFRAAHGVPPIPYLGPIGGTILIIGWLLLAYSAIRAPRSS